MGRSIILGYEVDGDGFETTTPVRVSREVLASGHVHIRGRTRSGKSSLSLLSLILQLIEGYQGPGGREAFDPIVIVDLGGDQALFHAVRTTTIAAGRRFRFVDLGRDPDVERDYFDPFEFFDVQGPMRQATALIEALNLDPGLTTDKVYFALQNLGAVLTALREIADSGRHPTLEEVASRLDMKRYRDAQQIWMTLQMLLEYPQLSPPDGADPDQVLSFRRALQDGEVVYLFTPTMNEATPARALAGLGMRNAIQAAIERTSQGLSERRVFIFADEFQEVAGRGFAATLAQSAKYDVSIFMANQTTDQLVSHDAHLASVVRDNTHIKIYFSVVGKADIEELLNYSGEDISIIEGGWSAGYHGTTLSAHAQKDFELSRNDILATSSQFGHAFLIFDSGEGYSPPRRVWMSHRIPSEIFQDIKRRPLPRRRRPVALPAPAIGHRKPESPTRSQQLPDAAPASLALLIERKRQAESFTDPSII
jgi:hypothetical protein